ncbi:MAG TPA: hypothetical protein VN428_21225 [Bryobacteraceae bacterium]|nr:hypothetical protein [Bryobacteraceae bacterium]
MDSLLFDAAREWSQKPFTPEAPYDRFRTVTAHGVEDAAHGMEDDRDWVRRCDARRHCHALE